VKRPRALQVSQRDEALPPQLPRLKAEPPFGGYRGIWADLHVVDPLAVQTTRMLRLRREPHLGGRPNVKRQAKRTPNKSPPGRPGPPRGGGGR
jgi:hypothetical protein